MLFVLNHFQMGKSGSVEQEPNKRRYMLILWYLSLSGHLSFCLTDCMSAGLSASLSA